MSRKRNGELGEKIVSKALESLPSPHYLINNLMLEDEKGKTHQIDHIYINQYAVFVLETKSYYGNIDSNMNDSIWFKRYNNKKEIIANPLHQNISHCRIVKKIIGKDIDVVGAVIFVNDNAPYIGDENTINLFDLSLFISSYPNKTIYNEKQMQDFYQTLLFKESDKSIKTHLNNIKEIRKNRKDKQKEIASALETRICPKCGGVIIEKENTLICSRKGCNFKIKF